MKADNAWPFASAMIGAALTLAVASCGDDDKKESAPEITYATLKTGNAAGTDASANGDFPLTKVATCTSNADTGVFEAKFAKGQSQLTLKMKGFDTAGGTVTCKQASDNTGTDVGQKYDKCMVEVRLPNATNKSKYDIYAMHRDTEDVQPFTYAGKKCEITYTYKAPRVEGTVVCDKMVQTWLGSARRNPVAADVTVDVVEGTTFYCDIK